MWKNKVKKKENSARICFSWFDWDQHGEGVRPVMAAGNFILLQMGVKYFLSHPQPQVLYDKSYQESFYKICIYLWRNGDRMDFYVIIVVTPVQYVISEDIRKEGCNVPRVWTRWSTHSTTLATRSRTSGTGTSPKWMHAVSWVFRSISTGEKLVTVNRLG